MTTNEQFFYDNAGYSYKTGIETPEQGHIRCASRLAEAENFAQINGWRVNWEYEQESPAFYCAVLRDSNGKILESLGMIENPDSNYRRVVEAELALDHMQPEDFADYVPTGDLP